MLFFDHNNLFLHFQYRKELKDLTESKKYYKGQIEKTQQDLELLKSNPLWMEKVAREQYLMKREGEDIFLIKENWTISIVDTIFTFSIRSSFNSLSAPILKLSYPLIPLPIDDH